MVFLPSRRFVFVDVGAYHGEVSKAYKEFLRAYPYRFYLIEPNPVNFALLKETMAEYNLYNCAISDHDGTGELFYHPDFLNSGSLWKEMPAGKGGADAVLNTDVDCLTMDSFMKKNRLSHVDFLKVNCEGGEYKMFTAPTIEFLDHTTYILISWHGKREVFNSDVVIDQRKTINDLLINKGFRWIDGVKPRDIGNYGSKSHSLQYWKKD